MTLPSKELLSEVLGCDCNKCYFEDTYNIIHYSYEYDVTWSEEVQSSESEINIYELAHKCKEWAFKYGKFQIYSGRFSDSCGRNCIATIKWYEGMWRSIDFTEAEEHEAIFKACQWILDNKETQ